MLIINNLENAYLFQLFLNYYYNSPKPVFQVQRYTPQALYVSMTYPSVTSRATCIDFLELAIACFKTLFLYAGIDLLGLLNTGVIYVLGNTILCDISLSDVICRNLIEYIIFNCNPGISYIYCGVIS
jgi:hypothetical protein